MATQKRVSRSSTKKATKSASTARKRAGLKAASPTRRKRASTTAQSRTGRKGGVLKRAIRKGISELAKVGT